MYYRSITFTFNPTAPPEQRLDFLCQLGRATNFLAVTFGYLGDDCTIDTSFPHTWGKIRAELQAAKISGLITIKDGAMLEQQ
jgi:hypothetical protein